MMSKHRLGVFGIFSASLTMVFLFYMKLSQTDTTAHRGDRVQQALVDQPIRSPYSWRQCVGDTTTPDAWKFRSCHYRNVCYDGNADGKLLYFAADDDDVDADKMTVCATVLGIPILDQPVPLNVTVVRQGPIPDDVIWLDPVNNSVAIIYVEYNAENFGHLVSDVIFPWFRLMEMFGVEGRQPRPLRFRTRKPWKCNCDWMASVGRLPNRDHCDRLYKKVANVFTNGVDVEVLQDVYSGRVKEAGKLICMKDVVAGTGYISDHGLDLTEHGNYRMNQEKFGQYDLQNVGHGHVYWRFRNEFMRKGGLPDNIRPITGRHDVVFMVKSIHGGAGQKDYKGAVASLDGLFKARNLTSYDVDPGRVLAEMSWPEQMEYMATTKVLVVTGGGASFAAMWLPKGSTLIQLWGDREMLDFAMWNNLPYIDVKWIRCGNDCDGNILAKSILAGLIRFDNAYT